MDVYEMVFKLDDVHQCSPKTAQKMFSIWSVSSEEDIKRYLYPSGRNGKKMGKRKYEKVHVD
jgi:hypothetical protein